jgi:hypothetical protein
MEKHVSRRAFVKTGVAVGASLTILKSGVLRGANAPSNTLNIAVVGCGGRGRSNLNSVKSENIVALCDVNEQNLASAAKSFPQAKTYTDWRKCLDQKDIDAVACSTCDHTHAFVNVWAMNRGKHVYCEKPLANSVYEARAVREAYLKRKDKIATQMGTQIHATENYRRVVELVKQGAIGAPKEAHAFCTRMPEGGSYLPGTGVPAHIQWDLWLGPSPYHPYNDGYIGSCLKWNRFWDFGSGQIGDMGSHIMDLAYWAYDLRFPTSCEAQGPPVSPDTCPQWLTAKWEHPARGDRPAVTVFWYDGGKKPKMPSALFDPEKVFKGIFFKGDQGTLVTDYDYRILFPSGDMTNFQTPKKEQLIPPSLGQHEEWIEACKGNKTTLCNFDYSGALVEHNLLALVAYRVGKKLQWDAENLRATNAPEADQYIKKTYREGWTLNG